MDINETTKIMNWFAENCDKLTTKDKLLACVAAVEFCEKIKPLYLKYQMNDGKSTFFMKL